MLGPFHVELSFFKALGKFIDRSGIDRLFVTSNLIEEGSLNAVIKGKHYKRCKKLHTIAAVTFKILHFENFLKLSNKSEVEIKEIFDILSFNSNCIDETLMRLDELLGQYRMYFEQSLKGEYGKTNQFVCIYMQYMDTYNHYQRAVRTCDLKLYKYAAYQLSTIFFVFNHQNYARYLSKNLSDLENIDKTHPGLSKQLENGGLSIRRTSKNFARTPVDLTVEQTINAHSACKMKGIRSFTTSIDAKHRWAETHAERMTIMHNLFEFIQITKVVKKFKQNVQVFVQTVKTTLNPFDDELEKTKLFNLTTGKAASSDTEHFLLNVMSEGLKQLQNFKQECSQKPSRFNQLLKRNVIRNFSHELLKNQKQSSVNAKLNQMRSERDVLAHILCVIRDSSIDLKDLFIFPLTVIPHSIASYDGSIHRCKQGDVLTVLCVKSALSENTNVTADIEIIDGVDFLNSIQDPPAAYGKLAEVAIKQLCKTKAKEIHLIFARHEPNRAGIKNYELCKNSSLYSGAEPIIITGAKQERTMPLSKCLKNLNFQNELVQFLLEYWSLEQEIIPAVLDEKRVVVSFGGECFLYSNEYNRKKPLYRLFNNHIETETKIILHLSKTDPRNSVVIKTKNSDAILVYTLYHMQYLNPQQAIYIETGQKSKFVINKYIMN